MTADEVLDQAIKYTPYAGAIYLSTKMAENAALTADVMAALRKRRNEPVVRALMQEFRDTLNGTSKQLPDFKVGGRVRVDIPYAPPNMRAIIKAFVPGDHGGQKAILEIDGKEIQLPLSLLTPISAVDLLGEVFNET